MHLNLFIGQLGTVSNIQSKACDGQTSIDVLSIAKEERIAI